MKSTAPIGERPVKLGFDSGRALAPYLDNTEQKLKMEILRSIFWFISKYLYIYRSNRKTKPPIK